MQGRWPQRPGPTRLPGGHWWVEWEAEGCGRASRGGGAHARNVEHRLTSGAPTVPTASCHTVGSHPLTVSIHRANRLGPVPISSIHGANVGCRLAGAHPAHSRNHTVLAPLDVALLQQATASRQSNTWAMAGCAVPHLLPELTGSTIRQHYHGGAKSCAATLCLGIGNLQHSTAPHSMGLHPAAAVRRTTSIDWHICTLSVDEDNHTGHQLLRPPHPPQRGHGPPQQLVPKNCGPSKSIAQP
jgi:hypothetical protein